ncbi:WD40 repeat domain-containing serine/threonine protein kinase [Actinomadura rifamycini]|uniref:WD40 repeat domain-containing serine/threonine protein kinase n=1 Tax=Actinomadura rifamycini TaxID=31962 RepID=UPI00047D90CF|nr:serine/threonine-protein kinase [Actinomadura rifamycini]
MSDRLEAGDPERIGEFWLAGRLGAGGQGVVYDAYGPDGTRVAVKVLHGAQEAPRELALMAAEARAAQRVASFCTARILQVRLEPPRPYIVSEYIDGLSLQGTVKGAAGRPGRRFAGDDLHRLGIGIATALTAIHQAKVVHRDLKPGNVMLGPDGPRLIDFGIARVLDTHSATEGAFAGTLRYMAPEVYAGRRAGAEADVFAWGAIMVFAATGEHAFQGGTLPEIAHRIRTHHPDLAALPDALRPLVEAALAKDPLARPSARAVLAALTRDPREGPGGPDDLVAAGAAQAGLRSRWEPGDPALGKVAEDVYAALPPREQGLVPEVFLRCVVPGEDGSLATRPVALAELSDRERPDEARALEHVVRAFEPLLVVAGDQVVLARPAVLRAWPRLRDWAEDERDGLRVHHRVREAARTWADHGRRRGDVLTGAHLDEAVRWATAAGSGPSLNRLERGLLDASTRARTARGRRTRAAAAVLAVTTLVSLTATGWAIRAQRTTVDQRDIAASRQLAAQSRQFGATAPDKAALLAVAAHGIRETPESRAALLNIVTHPARGVLNGYRGDPRAVAADRAGRLLAIGNKDGTIGLWDVRRHRRAGGFLRLFEGDGSDVPMMVALSPDGRTLAGAAADEESAAGSTWADGDVRGTVRFWDVRTRRPLGELPVSSGPGSVVFAPDGKSAAVNDGAEIALWDVGTTLRRRGPVVRAAESDYGTFTVVSPDATAVATGEVSGELGVWDLASGERTASFPVEGAAVALSPDARTVVTAESGEDYDTYVRFYDARTGKQRSKPIRTSLAPDVGPFSPDGRAVFIGTQLRDTATGARLGTLPVDSGDDAKIVSFAGEHTVVSLTANDFSRNTVRLWDVTVHQPDRRPFDPVPPDERDGLNRHGFSPDRRTMVTLAAVGGQDAFRTWDVGTGKQTRPPVPAPSDANGRTDADPIVVRPGGGAFAVADLEARIKLWDQAARRWSVLDDGPGGVVNAMALSPDGRILAAGRGHLVHAPDRPADGRVQLWDLDARAPIGDGPLFTSGEQVTALAFSPDGTTLAAGIGRTVRLWNVADGEELDPPISGLTGTVAALAFAPDNRTLAIGAADATTLWDVRGRRQIGAPLAGHSDRVTSLAFSRDGETLATGGDDGVVRLWDVTGQSQIGAPLTGHADRVAAMSFDPDAAVLTTSDGAATVRRWNIAMPADPAATACTIAGRTLTRAEWAQYVPPGIDYRDTCPSLSGS